MTSRTMGAVAPLQRSADSWASRATVFVVLAGAVLLTRGIWFGNPVVDIDEQLYSLIGNGMLHGQLPYVDNWDRKPFGLFALFALAHWVGGPGPIAYQAMAALFTLGGALLIYRLSRDLVDWVSATVAALIYIALMSVYGSRSGQSEALFMPMMLAMVALVRDPAHPHAFARACWAMLIGGLALQVKYTVVPQCVALGLWVLWNEFRRRTPVGRLAQHALLFAVLGLLPTVAVGVFYALIGEWDAYFFANFLSFFDRATAPWGRFQAKQLPFLAPIIVLVAGGVYTALRMSKPVNGLSYTLFVLWFGSCVATAYLPGTIYAYYFGALVPGAVLVALPFIDRKGRFGPVPMLLLVAAFSFILLLPKRYVESKAEASVATQMAATIAPLVDARHCLFVFDGPTAFYRMTGSCHPTRFIYPDHLNNELERHSLGISQADEVRRILATLPPVIVTADTPFTVQNKDSKALVDAAIARDYVPLAYGKLNDRIVRAWRRRD